MQSEEEEFLSKDESSFDFKSLIPKILRIWPLILLSVILFSLTGYIWTKFTVPMHRVSSLFFIKEKESALALFEAPSVMDNGNLGLQNEVIILKSKPIAEATLRQLDFDVEYYLKNSFALDLNMSNYLNSSFVNQELYRNTPIIVEVDWKSPQVINGLFTIKWDNINEFTLAFNDEIYDKFLPDGTLTRMVIIPEDEVFKFGEWIERNHFRIKVSKTGAETNGEILVKLRDVSSLVWWYASSLNIQPVERQASIINLSLVTPHSTKGQVYLNTLMQTYLDLELSQKNEIAANTIAFIDSQVAGVADSLRFFEGQLETFRSDNKIYNLSNESSTVFENLTEYERELKQEQFKRSYYQNLKEYLLRENYRDLVVPSGLGIDDPILNALISNLLAFQVEKSRLLATQTEASPAVKEVNRKIQDLNISIREILSNVDQNSLLLIRNLQTRIGEIEQSFRSLPQTEQNLIRIERQFTLNENIYTYLMQKRAESAITKASNTSNNKIIEPAAGVGQVSPMPRRNYIFAFLMGLGLPIMIVVSREFLRTKIEDVKFLEQKLKVPVLATILLNKKQSNLVVFEQGKSGIAEGFRSLRANIKFILPKESQLTIMVTSTISGEGKTFCSMNLASVYSLTGKRTLLVGCDMRKPKIFEDFGMVNDMGLSTILSGQEEDWRKVVKPTKFENLDILVSGPTPPNPAELLFTETFGNLIKELKENYDIVILDTPPVGLVSETLDLLDHVDMTLFVFRQNFSQRAFVDAVNGLKTKKGIKNVYAVFNGVDRSKVTYGYGYSYGYGYGYYDDDKKKK